MNKLQDRKKMIFLLSCAFTGYRPEKLPYGNDETHADCQRLKGQLYEEIERLYRKGVRIFLCGMARGVDTWAGEAVLRYMEQHPDVQLWAIVPFDGYAAHWRPDDQARYQRLLQHAQEIVYIEKRYNRGCFQRRNRFMIDRADYLIAVCSAPAGGTAATIAYARRRGVPMTILSP